MRMTQRRTIWRWVLLVVVLAVVALGFGGAAAVQHVPTFYAKALEIPEPERAARSDAFLAEVTALSSQLRQPGQWSAVFTDEQVNGWFAHDLKLNHPKALPPEMAEPRIALRPVGSRIACRWTQNGVAVVCSVEFDATVSGPNQVAVRLRSLRAGAIPLPRGQWVDAVSRWAVEAKIPLRWMQAEGDPVAVVNLPQLHEQEGARPRVLHLEAIQVQDGRVALSGSTESAGGSPSSPPPPPSPPAKKPAAPR